MPETAPELEFRNFGEQLLAVRQAALSHRSDPRLESVQCRATTIAPAGGSEMVPSDGGFLVAPEFSRDILHRTYATGQILKRCFGLPMKSSSLKFPQFSETSRQTGARLGGVQCLTENEAQKLQLPSAGAYSIKPTFALTTLTAKKITGLLYLTDELAGDTDAFNTWATYAFSQELTFTLENQIVNGTGAGECQGILSAPCLVTVPKQTGQNAGSIVGANVIGMTSQLWAASRPNAIFLYNQQALQSLGTLSLNTGSAQVLLWHFSEDASQPDTLCGIPAVPSEYCAAPGAAGDIVLADFSRYVVGTREMRAEVSIHVLYLEDSSTYRFVLRIDGQPIDQAPIQPLNATQASPPDFFVSPFVALAARS